MRAQQEAIAKPHVKKAREYLKGKRWAKSWRLAEALGVTPQVAGTVLAYLPEWELWNRDVMNRKGRAWKRRAEG